MRVVSTQKLPMVPEVVRLMPRMSATATDDARRRGPEIMRGQAGHLGEIAHGGFGRIGLPVGVGGEAGGGVPGQVRSNCGQALRIPGQHMLCSALDGVGQQHGDGREAQHGEGVLAPVHFLVGVHAAELVDEPLDGAEHADPARCVHPRVRGPGKCPPDERLQAGSGRRGQTATSRWRTCQNFSGKSRVRAR